MLGSPSVMIQTEVNYKGNYFQTYILIFLILLTGKTYFLVLCISEIHVILLVLHSNLYFYNGYVHSLCHFAVKLYFFKVSSKLLLRIIMMFCFWQKYSFSTLKSVLSSQILVTKFISSLYQPKKWAT